MIAQNYNYLLKCYICSKSLDLSHYSNTSLRKYGYFKDYQNNGSAKKNFKSNRFKINCKACTANPRQYIVCNICNVKKLLNCFSKTQRKKGQFSKCLKCSEEIESFNPYENVKVINNKQDRMDIDGESKNFNATKEFDYLKASQIENHDKYELPSINGKRSPKKILYISPSINQLDLVPSPTKEVNLCKKFQNLTLDDLLTIDNYGV